MSAYPIKDFRDPTQYPAHKSTVAWQWEFLRRNASYQRFYEQYSSSKHAPGLWEFGVRTLHDPHQDHAYRAFLSAGRIIGLPNFEWLERWKKVPGYTPERALEMLMRTLTSVQFGGDTLAVIDRSLPIQPQLDSIREAVESSNRLDGMQPSVSRDRTEKWPDYLRILDADAARVPLDEISEAVFPHVENTEPNFAGRDRVRKQLKVAKALTESFGARKFASGK